MARPLNPKQQRFVAEYLVDLNATQAAIRAGYSPRTAYSQGHDLLKKPEIQAAITEGRQAVAARLDITVERVLREIATVAFQSADDILDFPENGPPTLKVGATISQDARRTISGVKVRREIAGHGDDKQVAEVTEIKRWSKDGALEKLAKHLGILVEKHEHTGKDGAPIAVRWGTPAGTLPE